MKDIPGYEGLYAITSCGKVWSYTKNRFLTDKLQPSGYHNAILYKNGEYKNFKIHRLVAQAYIDNPNNYSDVNHKDENKANNCVNNLEWCDHKYNCNYGHRNELLSKTILCIETNEIKKADEFAKDIGCYPKSIYRQARGERSHCKGYHFKYIN